LKKEQKPVFFKKPE